MKITELINFGKISKYLENKRKFPNYGKLYPRGKLSVENTIGNTIIVLSGI
jgi:hypothetical protein